MIIKNYLFDLDKSSFIKKGSDSIRIYGIGYIIKKIYVELKKYKSISEIENEFKTHQIFSNWILNKNGVPIQTLYSLHIYWQSICNKSIEEFEASWEKCYKEGIYFGCMNGKKIKLPKEIDFKLAYLLGYIIGDGHLADPNVTYDRFTSYNSEIRITDQNKETFIFLAGLFKDLFNYKPMIYCEMSKSNKPFYRFVIKSKPIHRFLMIVCGIPVGDKRGKTKIPKIIMNSELELQKWFISGFFDADGCITHIKSRWPVITITQYSQEILKEILIISFKLRVH